MLTPGMNLQHNGCFQLGPAERPRRPKGPDGEVEWSGCRGHDGKGRLPLEDACSSKPLRGRQQPIAHAVQ